MGVSMSTIRFERWWPVLLADVAEKPVADLALRYRVSTADIDRGLVEESEGGAVQNEPWWPEVIRLHETVALRRLARRFRTNPRRLRRGLARCALRAGGETLGENGNQALKPYIARLGREPDHVIASLAKNYWSMPLTLR